MAKALDAPYEAGSRGASWLKVKRAHTLDLVVLAAEWGHGRRKGWLSNLHLGARDPATGGFVMLGKTFKGMTDALLEWQTQELLAREIRGDGYTVYVRPELVVEIAFNDLQASPHYPGGLALRFARVKGYRADKRAEDADTIETVRKRYLKLGIGHPRSSFMTGLLRLRCARVCAPTRPLNEKATSYSCRCVRHAALHRCLLSANDPVLELECDHGRHHGRAEPVLPTGALRRGHPAAVFEAVNACIPSRLRSVPRHDPRTRRVLQRNGPAIGCGACCTEELFPGECSRAGRARATPLAADTGRHPQRTGNCSGGDTFAVLR